MSKVRIVINQLIALEYKILGQAWIEYRLVLMEKAVCRVECPQKNQKRCFLKANYQFSQFFVKMTKPS